MTGLVIFDIAFLICKKEYEGQMHSTATVHLFVFDSMTDHASSSILAALNQHGRPARFRLQTVARAIVPITTASGARVQPDLELSELSAESSDLLILPDGASWEHGSNFEALAKAHEFLFAHTPVAAIGSATLAMARAGLLEGRRHTGNSRPCLAATEYGAGHLYRDAPAVSDRGLITACADTSTEFARELTQTLGISSAEILRGSRFYRGADCSGLQSGRVSISNF
jgi:putative intracellular protease/amidase